jgi:hypothetical protein
MKQRYILVVTVILITFSGMAQNNGQTVRGVVVDAFTGNPIARATVQTLESNPVIGSTTDDKGEFVLKGIPTGRCSFTASIVGYSSQTFSNIMVISGKETVLSFKLEEKVTHLNDVVVKASHAKERPLNDMALISARSFSVEETERYAGSLGDPARMVANYAGVMAGNDSRNDIIIRGNSPMGLLWRIEGVEVPNPNHFGAQGTTGGPVSMLNSNLLANSDFMTGAFPAEYGNALSGVFDINLRSGNKDKYEFTGQVGFNGFEAAAEGPIPLGKNAPKGSFIIDYRYSTLELVSKLGFNVGTGSAVPQYNDLTVLADFPTLKMGRFKFVGILGNSFISLGRSFDKAQAISSNQLGYATDFGAGLNIAMLTHTFMFSEKSRLKSAISFQSSQSATQNDSIDYANKTYFSSYAGKLLENKLTASVEFKHKFSSQNNFTTGILLNRYITSFNDSAWVKSIQKRLTLTQVNNEPTTLYEAFVNWQHKFSDNLILNGGLHYQFYDLNKESALEPRLGMEWKVSPNQSFSLGYGLHSQLQPHATYFYKEYNRALGTYSENNQDLKFTRSQHFVLGYDWHLGRDFRIKSEVYYQGIFNVPVSTVNGAYSMLNSGSGYFIANVDSLQNTGKGQNKGVELTVEKFLNQGYYALMTVSLFDSKSRGYDMQWRNTAFDTNYALNLLGGYEFKIGKKNLLTLDLRTVWSGGMRYIPIDLPASIAANEQVNDWSKAYANKYKDYFRCDLRIGFKQNLKHVSQEWALDLQNVTNNQNIYSEQYNNQSRSISTIFQQGFLPMMLYRINF